MLPNDHIDFFEQVFFQTFGKNIPIKSFEVLTGGCINNAVKIALEDKKSYFLKFNQSDKVEMFEAEAKGLDLLKQTDAIAIPEVLAVGITSTYSYLLLEFLPDIYPKPTFWQSLGQSLALLHAHTHSQFGLNHNNFIGSLPQSNEQMSNGIQFFIEKRLKVQAGLAFYNQLLAEEHLQKFENLYQKLPELLPSEKPALLHGDLWNGNVIVNQKGQPALIDPAVYYGLRESELAFTQLFGGFDDEFLDVYKETFPLEKGFAERLPIYNLYPLLVHLNLFGTAYLKGIENILNRFA